MALDLALYPRPRAARRLARRGRLEPAAAATAATGLGPERSGAVRALISRVRSSKAPARCGLCRGMKAEAACNIFFTGVTDEVFKKLRRHRLDVQSIMMLPLPAPAAGLRGRPHTSASRCARRVGLRKIASREMSEPGRERASTDCTVGVSWESFDYYTRNARNKNIDIRAA